MPHGDHLDADEEIHALRMLPSTLHGFAELEAAGGFRGRGPVDESFTWMLRFLDQGFVARRGLMATS